MKILFRSIPLVGAFFMSSCAAFFNPPLYQTPARTGEFTKSTKILLDLPPAAQPVEVAVYNLAIKPANIKLWKQEVPLVQLYRKEVLQC